MKNYWRSSNVVTGDVTHG